MLKLIIASIVALSSQAISLENCRNYTQTGGVSFSYESCVNRNFREISYELDLNLYHCTNYSNQVDPSFTSCINRNFQNVRRTANRLFLMNCYNYGTTLNYYFVSCTNRNFEEIQKYINLNTEQ